MSGPKRNPDRLNTIGVVVVGICGAVLVYVTIVALQAFYVNDTSDLQTAADYEGQDMAAKSLRTDQLGRINEYGTNPRPAAAKPGEAPRVQTYRIPIDVAMKRVVEDARTDPGALVPALGRSEKATVLPIFGRPRPIQAPAAAAPAPAAAPGAPAAAPGAPAAAGNGATAGSTAAPAAAPPAAPMVPTGAGTGPAPVPGAGPIDKPAAPATPGHPTGPAPATANPPAAPAPGTPPKGNGK